MDFTDVFGGNFNARSGWVTFIWAQYLDEATCRKSGNSEMGKSFKHVKFYYKKYFIDMFID